MSSLLTLRRSGQLFTRPKRSDSTNSCKDKQAKPSLLSYEQLPQWFQDNPHIRSAYRPISQSCLDCLYSWTYLHNESLNIYTHLVPAVLTLAGQFWLQLLISYCFPKANMLDRFIFSGNLFAATVTLSLSTMYHTLMNHSMPVSFLCLRIDYLGILTLILGSFFSGIFVGFFCDPFLQRVYWTMILTLSTITSVLVLHPRLQGLKYRPFRTIAFVLTGLSGFAPVAHGLLRHGWNEMWLRSGMPFWFLEGLLYVTGAFFYDTRFPESVWPGKFDIWGSSHQIFHVLVVFGGTVHMLGVWSAYSWNYHHNRECAFIA